MKTIRIPFRYRALRNGESLTFEDIVSAVTACKRLGLQPVGIVVGTDEFKALEQMRRGHSEKNGIDCLSEFLLFVQQVSTKSELIFHCQYE